MSYLSQKRPFSSRTIGNASFDIKINHINCKTELISQRIPHDSQPHLQFPIFANFLVLLHAPAERTSTTFEAVCFWSTVQRQGL